MTYNEEKAFIDLIKTNQNIIHKISILFYKNEEDKKDLSQEIILQLWKSYHTFKGNSKFSTWMYKVALNTAVSMTKKKSILISPIQALENSISFDSNSDLSDDIKLLYKGIRYLNKIEKAVILLWLEEMSYDEIAHIMGISEKNVSVKLVRVKKKLSVIIKKLQSHE